MEKWLSTDTQARNWGMIFSLVVTLAIILLVPLQIGLELEVNPTGSGLHYDWQLADPNVWSQITSWGGFVVHTLLIWWTVYAATNTYDKYSDKLRPMNYWALGINAVFIVLHYIQTAVFYDTYAQYIPSWTAQYAVIMMLVVILGMENKRRGMFFGKKVPFKKEFYRWLKEYHSYAFSFAIIYTFWFHPMVTTGGHLFGFLYTMLVMVQGSLMYTRAHLNNNWKFLLEIMVLPHAAYIAFYQSNMLFYMFTLGFGAIFITTQMHGLKLKRWVQNTFYVGFFGLVLLVYGFLREPYQANEVIRIPIIEYLTIFVIYALWFVVTWIISLFNKGNQTPETAFGD